MPLGGGGGGHGPGYRGRLCPLPAYWPGGVRRAGRSSGGLVFPAGGDVDDHRPVRRGSMGGNAVMFVTGLFFFKQKTAYEIGQ